MKTFQITISRPVPEKRHTYTMEDHQFSAESIEEALARVKLLFPESFVPAVHMKGMWEEVK